MSDGAFSAPATRSLGSARGAKAAHTCPQGSPSRQKGRSCRSCKRWAVLSQQESEWEELSNDVNREVHTEELKNPSELINPFLNWDHLSEMLLSCSDCFTQHHTGSAQWGPQFCKTLPENLHWLWGGNAGVCRQPLHTGRKTWAHIPPRSTEGCSLTAPDNTYTRTGKRDVMHMLAAEVSRQNSQKNTWFIVCECMDDNPSCQLMQDISKLLFLLQVRATGSTTGKLHYTPHHCKGSQNTAMGITDASLQRHMVHSTSSLRWVMETCRPTYLSSEFDFALPSSYFSSQCPSHMERTI